MIHGSFDAMGTVVEAWVEDEDGLAAVRAWMERVESVCSRFRPDSELSLINASDDGEHEVSALLTSVLDAAHDARSMTGGLVDIGVGAAMRAWGYDRTFSEVGSIPERPDRPRAPSWDLRDGRLRRGPGTSIDVGGIAKGWACDQAVERGLASVVSAGGDMRSAHPDTRVPILDPWDEVAAEVHLGIGGLATSSVSRRRWRVETDQACHVMDPRTMSPVETPVLSASVVAETALEAEVGAKAIVILGEQGLAWASDQDWIRAAVVVWHDGSVYATSGVELAA